METRTKYHGARFLMVGGTADPAEQTSHQLYGYCKSKVRKGCLKYDPTAYNECVGTFGPTLLCVSKLEASTQFPRKKSKPQPSHLQCLTFHVLVV